MLEMSIFLRSFLFVLFFFGRHAGDIIKVRLDFTSIALDQSISTMWKLFKKEGAHEPKVQTTRAYPSFFNMRLA